MQGKVGVPAYLSVKGTSSERLCLDHPFLKHHVVRESSGGDRVLWGKVRKPLQSVQTNHD